MRNYLRRCVYLEAPDEVCFHRRKVRDITERGRSLDFILWQYENNVLPAVQQYVVPSKSFADLVLDGASNLVSVEKSLYDAIMGKRSLAGKGWRPLEKERVARKDLQWEVGRR